MSDNTLFKKFENELNEITNKTGNKDALQTIFEMQCELMKRYGHEPTWLKTPFIEQEEMRVMTENGVVTFPKEYIANQKELRTKLLLDMVHAMDDEVSEFRGELPWKHWKKYKPEDMWYNNENVKLAAGFELIDILHFMMESFILLGFDWEDIKKLYLVKNIENFHRQDVGYDNSYKEDDKCNGCDNCNCK